MSKKMKKLQLHMSFCKVIHHIIGKIISHGSIQIDEVNASISKGNYGRINTLFQFRTKQREKLIRDTIDDALKVRGVVRKSDIYILPILSQQPFQTWLVDKAKEHFIQSEFTMSGAGLVDSATDGDVNGFFLESGFESLELLQECLHFHVIHAVIVDILEQKVDLLQRGMYVKDIVMINILLGYGFNRRPTPYLKNTIANSNGRIGSLMDEEVYDRVISGIFKSLNRERHGHKPLPVATPGPSHSRALSRSSASCSTSIRKKTDTPTGLLEKAELACAEIKERPLVVAEPTVAALWDPCWTPQVAPGGMDPAKINSVEDLDHMVAQCIREVAAEGCYTGVGEVVNRLMNILPGGVSRLSQLSLRRPEDIPSVFQHQRIIQRVNASVWAFIKVRPVVTLHEIHLLIEDICPNYRAVLGPLTKLPVVIETMRPGPAMADPPWFITASDVIGHLIELGGPKKYWRSSIKRLEPEEQRDNFLEDLARILDAPSPEQLGVRICVFPMLVQIVQASNNFHRLDKICRDILEKDIHAAYSQLASGILDLDESRRPVIQQNYLRMRSEEVVIDFLEKLEVLMSALTKWGGTAAQSTLGLKQLRRLLKKDTWMLRRVFRCLIVVGRSEIEANKDELVQRLVEGGGSADYVVTGVSRAIQYPDPDDVLIMGCSQSVQFPEDVDVEEVKQSRGVQATEISFEEEDGDEIDENTILKAVLEATSQSDGLSLMHLCEIESRTLVALGVARWPLKKCSFLQFLNRYKNELTKISGPLESTSDELMVDREKVENYLSRIPNVGQLKSEDLVDLVTKRFSLAKSNALRKFLSETIAVSGRNAAQDCCIVDEAALLSDSPSTSTFNLVQGSLLTSRSAVVQLLGQCPPLMVLGDWVQWDIVFAPVWGDLSDFLLGSTIEASAHNLIALGSSHSSDLVRLYARPCVEVVTSELDQWTAKIGRDMRELCGQLASLRVIEGRRGGRGASGKDLVSVMLENGLRQAAEKGCSLDDVSGTILHSIVHLVPSGLAADILTQWLLPSIQAVWSEENYSHILEGLVKTYNEDVTNDLLSCHRIGLLRGLDTWMTHFREHQIQRDAMIMSVVHERSVYTSMEVEICNNTLEKEAESTSAVAFNFRETTTELPQAATDHATVESMTSSNDPRAIVESIRKWEFGLGLEMTDETQTLVQRYQSRLGRCLDRLSDDLYSRSAHFLLELVQNADDNTYPSSPVVPTLELCAGRRRLLVSNNELGFTEGDLRALCDVGSSTKAGFRADKIGRKGIGFKSVFRVSPCPQVHSRGFHIEFSILGGGSGALVPKWTPPSNEVRERESTWNTQIVLPLDQGQKETQHDLWSGLAAMAPPALMLFLRRLKRIALRRETDTTTTPEESAEEHCIVLERQDLESGLVEIRKNSQPHRWFVHHVQFPCKVISKQLRDGGGLDNTTISVAIPLSDSVALPQPVFAYLPIRSFGYRFILNADFEIPASREDIDEDSQWNRWLFTKIQSALLDAFDAALKIDEASIPRVQIVTRLLDCVPLPGEVSGPFRPIVGEMRGQLASLPWLLDTEGELRAPVNLLLPYSGLHQLTGSSEENESRYLFNLLRERLALHMVHDSLVTSDPDDAEEEVVQRRTAVLKWLGCQPLGLEKLLDFGCSLTPEETCQPDMMPAFFCLMERGLRAADPGTRRRTLAGLGALPILALEGGGEAAVGLSRVFMLPTDEGIQRDTVLKLSRDHNILASWLLSSGRSEMDVAVRALMGRLDVQELTPDKVIDLVILPRMETIEELDSAAAIDEIEWLVLATRFILDQCPGHRLSEVCTRMPLLTVDKHIVRTGSHPIHFPFAYGARLVLSELFPRHVWTNVSSMYIAPSSAPSVRARWLEFLTHCGVTELPFIRIIPAEEEGELGDFEMPELDQLLTEVTMETGGRLLAMLDREWPKLSRCSGSMAHPSSWMSLLREKSWIPCRGNLRRPGDLFALPVSGTGAELDPRLLWQPDVPPRDAALIESLGFKRHLEADEVKFVLSEILNSPISVTLTQIQSLYKSLRACLPPDELVQLLTTGIFLPPGKGRSEPRFVAREETNWTSVGSYLTRPKLKNAADVGLVDVYGAEWEAFFVDLLEVPRYPSLSSLLALHTVVESSVSQLPSGNHEILDLLDWWAAIDRLSIDLGSSDNDLLAPPICLCRDGVWRRGGGPDRKVFGWRTSRFWNIMESGHTEDRGLLICGLDCLTGNAKHMFLERMQIPILEDCLSERVCLDRPAALPSYTLKQRFLDLVDPARSWIETHKEDLTYTSAACTKLDAVERFFEVPSVKVEFCLSGSKLSMTEEFPCRIVGDSLYIADSGSNREKVMAEELARYLLAGTQLEERFRVFLMGVCRVSLPGADKVLLEGFYLSHGLPDKPIKRSKEVKIDTNGTKTESNSEDGPAFPEAANSHPSRKRPAEDIPNHSVETSSSRYSASRASDGTPRNKMPRLTTNSGHLFPTFHSTPAQPNWQSCGSEGMESLGLEASLWQPSTSESSQVEDSPWPSAPPPHLANDMAAVGRFGELLVYQHLRSQGRLDGASILGVEWTNEGDETGAPYDLRVSLQGEGNTEPRIVYIEVKSTVNDEKRSFEISANQVLFASEIRSNFVLFRVFNALDPDRLRIEQLSDLYGQLEKKAVALRIFV